MKVVKLLENLQFGSKDAHAEPLHVDKEGRAILFTLKPAQSIREHNAPSSPFFVVILKGEGIFTGGDGTEYICGPNTLLIFDAAEQHTIRAAANELIFVGFLHGAPLAQNKL
jgi:quercetin dioxygenase-like cupin family protein